MSVSQVGRVCRGGRARAYPPDRPFHLEPVVQRAGFRLPLAEFESALADAIFRPRRPILTATVIRLPRGTNLGASAHQERHGLLQARAFDPGEISQHYLRRAVDAGRAMDVDAVALAQQTLQPAHRRRQATPRVVGIEIAQGLACHDQPDPADVPDLTGIVDPLFFQAFIELQRQRGGRAGFRLERVQVVRIARAAPDEQFEVENASVQAPVGHGGTP